MTVEEAGEIILGDKAYEWCPVCHGCGSQGKATKGSQWSLDLEVCHRCGGLGNLESPGYREACRVIGRTMPPRPSTRKVGVTMTFDDRGFGKIEYHVDES